MAADDDSAARNPLGPVGQNVVANIRQLREARELAYTELSALLADLGRPIPVLGLSRIEKGKRRVDADDLVALALALRVNPASLLLPRALAAGDEEVALAPCARYPAAVAWSWADGHELPGHPGGHDFLFHARPEYQVRGKMEDLDGKIRQGRRIRDEAAALKAGPGWDEAARDFTDAARQQRDDFDRLARQAVPGFADADRAAEYAAWRRRVEEEKKRLDEEERRLYEEEVAAAERQQQEDQARKRASGPATEGGDDAEDPDD